MKTTNKMQTKTLVQLALLLAIEAIVCFTPLGSLPVGPLVATLSHIPVILAAIVMGTGAGAFMGFSFGLFSFLVWTFMPPNPLVAFAFTPAFPPGSFWSIVICFVPRILLGVIAGELTKLFLRWDKRGYAACTLGAILASLAHTLLVLGGIYSFFREPYAEAYGMTTEALLPAILVVIGTNGVVEAVIAAVVAVGIARVLPAIRRSIRG